jgi:lipopolysaccharide assembly outer membrane protein LptD (OstA)
VSEAGVYHLRGRAVIETTEMILRADEIDYDEAKHYAEARGNVKFDHFQGGEHIEADKVEYDLENETGKYYNVRGSSPAKIESRPGILTTNNPFSFEGKWAERVKNRYILHDGFVTELQAAEAVVEAHGQRVRYHPGATRDRPSKRVLRSPRAVVLHSHVLQVPRARASEERLSNAEHRKQ